MCQKLFSFFFFALVLHPTASAQLYPTQHRPPDQDWQQLKTPHFNLLYSRDNDTTALRLARILEDHYPRVQQLVGGELRNFPVILNSYNDRSNGFVTPLHFRSEIELPPLKGKSLNPQTGNWLTNVGPHELVHALQYNNLGQNNIPRLISLLSPDLARSFHGAIPAGITEGIAVQYETEQVAPGGGRGNFPMFTSQFDAVFNSDRRWSMGQMVQISSNTRPFNRHYIGGYMFSSWLQREFGDTATRNALSFYMNYPFLGYGLALRHVTGYWPGQLYSRFEKAYDRFQDSTSAAGPPPLNVPFQGPEIRRPLWLSDSTLVFHGSFYNARPGFYRYDLASGSMKRFLTTNSIQDYRYDLSPDRSKMVFSYYRADPLYNRTYKAVLASYNFSENRLLTLTDDARVYAPQYAGKQLLALQSRPASSALVSIPGDSPAENHNPAELLSLGEDEITAVSVAPDENRLVVVANKKGQQALWITDISRAGVTLPKHPDIAFEDGSVFDPYWHPSGQKLLFSSDFSGTHQLYEYDLPSETVSQFTQSAFNAFEGSYSPNGSRVAYIRQVGNKRLPVIARRTDGTGRILPDSLWQPVTKQSNTMREYMVSDSIRKASKSWEPEAYTSDISWLKPRAVLPFGEEVSNSGHYQFGLSLHSNDVLQSQAYDIEMSYLEERLWYDLSYENKQFYPGFRLQFYSEPSYINFQRDQFTTTLLRQNRSLDLSIPLDIQLRDNIFSTSLFIEPKIRYSQLRFYGLSRDHRSSDFSNITAANLYSQLNLRLQQNIRDIQPNSGIVLYSELEHYWNSYDLSIPLQQNNIRLQFQQPTALKAGLLTYLSPLRRWNQSMRLAIEGLSQSGLVFNNQSLVSDAFSEPVLVNADNLLSISSRYTIPLIHADEGGFLLPLYLAKIYLVAFSNTVADPSASDWYEQSRSVFGLGLRTTFRVSNLSFDLGIGYGYEPTRNQHQVFMGNF
ncbi:TolB family protein [Fodinibius sediminis]|uniref:WD40-like Beta Propeller Repeat n=1 Tax=Fodinibius sediminis TaxID=1214077 RepID=A0A521BF43_9BACT|nr:PD40 domain-containing protein [Fodinibius sediminis]SMO45704.1 WD40-like Beta Propeller Repeat [Fodinibius sediminis]